MLRRVRERGQLRPEIDEVALLLIVRAFTYGLSRLYVDRQLRVWLPEQADMDKHAILNGALDAFAEMLFLPGAAQPIRSEA